MKPERLTKKYPNGSYLYKDSPGKARHKLGQIEDIEEEHEVDAIILLRLVLEGCYVKDIWADKKGIVSHFKFVGLTYNGFEAKLNDGCVAHDFKFAHQGSTWAFTKEELE